MRTNYKSLTLCISCLILSFVLIACSDNSITPGDEIVFPETNVSFASHVQPFFNLRCGLSGCHDDQTRAGDLSLTSYITLTQRPGMVIPKDTVHSILLQKIDGRLPHSLEVPILINQNQLRGIKRWIFEGGKNN